jgi:hypothetical protein
VPLVRHWFGYFDGLAGSKCARLSIATGSDRSIPDPLRLYPNDDDRQRQRGGPAKGNPPYEPQIAGRLPNLSRAAEAVHRLGDTLAKLLTLRELVGESVIARESPPETSPVGTGECGEPSGALR